MSTVDWTADDITLCAKLWAAGRSASEIGRELGRGRNSICGFASRHRDICPHRSKVHLTKIDDHRACKGKGEDRARHHNATKAPVKPIIEVILSTPETLPPEALATWQPANPIAFLEIDNRHCKWPLWPIADNPGPAGLCCGEPIEAGLIYCAHHRRRSRGLGTRSEQAAPAVLERAAR